MSHTPYGLYEKYVKRPLDFCSAALLLIGNLIFLITKHSIPTLALVSAFVCFVGLAISVGAACLSHLVHKAATAEEGD